MSGLPEVRQNNQQLLNDIQSLQKMEQQLFSNLESNPTLSTTEQKKIIDKMNQLSQMRINLYKTLSGVNQYYGSSLESSIGTLKQQKIAIDIVEKELTRSKERLRILEAEKNNKIRLIEINNYYGDKYEEHAQLMKVVIFTLIPIIVFAYLNNIGILPNMVYYILLAIVTFIGAYYFWSIFSSILMRDNMNYQTYDWSFHPDKAPNNASTIEDPWDGGIDLTTCVGSTCCSTGMVYNDAINKCVKPTTTATSGTATAATKIENFETGPTLDIQSILTKRAPYNSDRVDYNLSQPEPFNNYS